MTKLNLEQMETDRKAGTPINIDKLRADYTCEVQMGPQNYPCCANCPCAMRDALLDIVPVIEEMALAKPERFSGADPRGDTQYDRDDVVDAPTFDALQEMARAVLAKHVGEG